MMELIQTPDGLVLTDGELKLNWNFEDLLPRIKRKGNPSGELILRAVKIKGLGRPLRIVDATAGLGEDSFLLAAAGHFVTMYEYNPMIAALLSDALARGSKNPEIAEIVERMELVEGDFVGEAFRLNLSDDLGHPLRLKTPPSASLPPPLGGEDNVIPDVVYLDPMFPERKKSGLIKKKFQLLQKIERPCENEAELFQAALESGAKRVVVKRPKNAPELAGKKPGYAIAGSVVRYDVYILR